MLRMVDGLIRMKIDSKIIAQNFSVETMIVLSGLRRLCLFPYVLDPWIYVGPHPRKPEKSQLSGRQPRQLRAVRVRDGRRRLRSLRALRSVFTPCSLSMGKVASVHFRRTRRRVFAQGGTRKFRLAK